MCFSANLSFGMGSVLLVAGIIAVKKTSTFSQIPFAAIPLLFSIQQFTEGFLWLSLRNTTYFDVRHISILIFLFFAQVIWPVWVPFSIFLLEKKSGRRKILLSFTALGVVAAVYLTFCLFHYTSSAIVNDHHIHYELDYPLKLVKFSGIFYFIPIVISPFISSVKKMWIIGTVLFLSFVITKLFFGEYVVSVWCYFAAAVSLIVCLIIPKLQIES